jgi:hypothetical protein
VDDQEQMRAAAPGEASAETANDDETMQQREPIEGLVWSSMDLPGMNPAEDQ